MDKQTAPFRGGLFFCPKIGKNFFSCTGIFYRIVLLYRMSDDASDASDASDTRKRHTQATQATQATHASDTRKRHTQATHASDTRKRHTQATQADDATKRKTGRKKNDVRNENFGCDERNQNRPSQV